MRRTGIDAPSALLVAAAFGAACLVPVATANAGSNQRSDYCPAARTSANTRFPMTQRRLAPGVTVSSTTMASSRGQVAVRILRVDLTQPGVGVTSLHRALASGHVLTSLASPPRIVAATNAMYFSLTYAAPVYPFIANGIPMVLSAVPQRVVGVATNQRAQDGNAWLSGEVTSGDAIMQLAAVNLMPPRGLSVFTSSWGSRLVPLTSDARTRRVAHGAVVSDTGRFRSVPAGGYLLVARGDTALRWLRALGNGAPVTVSRHVETDAPVPFKEAYGAGMQTVAHADQPSTHLYCTTTETLAARTSIAWTRSRSTLMLVTAESPRGPDNFGIDENQMSALLVHLRAAGGYALDGGTSTEMVARVPGRRHLVLETAPHGTSQRPMPVGIGIYYRP